MTLMKKMVFLCFAVMTIFISLPAFPQEALWHNCSNLYEPQILFANPAGLSFQSNRLTIFSSQFLYTGVSDDNLHNYYFAHMEPVRSFGVLGFRSQHFTSRLLNRHTFSLLFGRTIINSKFSLGVNLNIHQDIYNSSEFNLRDPDDPLLQEGTSKTSFSAGLGAVYLPFKNLAFGMSIDQINRPGVSIETDRAFRPMLIKAGFCHQFHNLISELNYVHIQYKNRNEKYFAFGLRQLLLDNSANISLQYIQNAFIIGAAYSFNYFQIGYQFTYPLNELNDISIGTNQFTISFNYGKPWGYPTRPKIELISPRQTRTDSSTFHVQALVLDQSGLEEIIVQLNDQAIIRRQYEDNIQSTILDVPVFPLKKGENTVRLTARNRSKQTVKKLDITYAPSMDQLNVHEPPRLSITTPVTNETRFSVIKLELSTENLNSLDDLHVKLNGSPIQLRGVQPVSSSKDRLDVTIEFDLIEGMNDIEIIGHNLGGSASQKRMIRYNPITEPLYNELWAVVIGIDEYKTNNVQDLHYAVNDAREIEKLLKEPFHFNHVITLYNSQATKDNIIRAISKDLAGAKEDDGVFFFFSGHGCTFEGIRGEALGFIVPVNGTFDKNEFYIKNIPMSQIREISQTIKAKHIYYVMDCCYGGLLLRTDDTGSNPPSRADYRFLRTLAKTYVRQVLTAGGRDQPVLDKGPGNNSVFTSVLVQALKGEADANNDGFITAEELNFFVRRRVYANVTDIVRGDPIYRNIEQTPQYGKWSGEGEFIFTSHAE